MNSGGMAFSRNSGCRYVAVDWQHGAALVVALLMLTVVMTMGISAANIALHSEKAARNDRDRQIAFQAAEAALVDAEQDIQGSPDVKTTRSGLFDGRRTEEFVKACGMGHQNRYLGLCAGDDRAGPAWRRVDFMDSGAQVRSVPYGRFTGQDFQTGEGSQPARLPRYIIEWIPAPDVARATNDTDAIGLYRITAVGFGVRDTTQVALQAYYRKNIGQHKESGRLAWREIENWEELHDESAR